MRNLLGVAAPTKKVDFLGKKGSVEILKLTGIQVKEFQKFLTVEAKKLPEEDQGVAVQNYLIRASVVGAADLTDDELAQFPLGDISSLASEILSYSGLGNKAKEEGND